MQPGAFYVTALLSGRYALMAGPYAEHEAALADVQKVRKIAESVDRRAIWAAFGTSRLQSDNPPAGQLNRHGLI